MLLGGGFLLCYNGLVLPSNLLFTCPHCSLQYDVELINGIGEFGCPGCPKHYRLALSTPGVELGDFERREISYEVDGCKVTEWEAQPQRVELQIRLVELEGEWQYWATCPRQHSDKA
jgi:hypothetical protein